jgi:hypothetical protein
MLGLMQGRTGANSRRPKPSRRLTRGDRVHVAELEQAAEDLRKKARAEDDPWLREKHTSYAERIDRLADDARRRPSGVGLWGFAIALTMTPTVLTTNEGWGWWGLIGSVAVAGALLLRTVVDAKPRSR